MLDENGKETGDPSKAKEIVTDYLSKAKEKTAGSNLIKAFDKTTGKLDYRDLKIVFKVSQDFKPSDGIIKNIAEIKEHEDEIYHILHVVLSLKYILHAHNVF